MCSSKSKTKKHQSINIQPLLFFYVLQKTCLKQPWRSSKTPWFWKHPNRASSLGRWPGVLVLCFSAKKKQRGWNGEKHMENIADVIISNKTHGTCFELEHAKNTFILLVFLTMNEYNFSKIRIETNKNWVTHPFFWGSSFQDCLGSERPKNGEVGQWVFS